MSPLLTGEYLSFDSVIRHLQELVADGIVKETTEKRFRSAFTIPSRRMAGRSPSRRNDVQLRTITPEAHGCKALISTLVGVGKD